MPISLYDPSLGGYEVEITESKALLDIEQEYQFTLISANVEKDVIASINAPEDWRWKELSELNLTAQQIKEEVSKKWLQDRLITEWATGEGDEEVVIRERWRIDKVNTSPTNPKFESRAALFAKALGKVVEPKKKVKMAEIIPLGLAFKAHVEEQRGKDGKGTGYHQLNLHTIREVKVNEQAARAGEIKRTPITDEQRAAVLTALDGFGKSQQADMGKLVEKKAFNLIDPFMRMWELGEITYGK